jgi:hypothetical protein
MYEDSFMSAINTISHERSPDPTEIDILTRQLPQPPCPPSRQTQSPEPAGFLGSFGVNALNIAETLGTCAGKIHRFVQAIFEEVFLCTTNAKALITEVFSSFQRVEEAVGGNSFPDPMASLSRAWRAATVALAQGTAEAAPGAAAASSVPEPARAQEPAQVSPLAQYKANLLSRIDGIEHKAIRLRDMALKIIVELGARLVALKNFITIGLDSVQEITRVFRPRPLSSPDLDPLFTQVSQLFERVVRTGSADGAKGSSKAV